MSVFSWLRPLAARLKRNHVRAIPQRPVFRPGLEELEDRITPSAVQLTTLNYVVGPHYLTPVGSTLYFVADDGHGPQLWRTDGQPGDTALVESGSQSADPGDQGQQYVAQVGSWLYFFSDNSDGTYTLWRNNNAVNPTGGTSPSQLIQNLDFDPTPENQGGGPYQLTAVGHDLYFGAYSAAVSGYQLWKVTGADGANPVSAPFPVSDSDAQGPYTLKAAGSNLYFSADYVQNGTTNFVLWGTDGTTAGTMPISEGNGGYVPGNSTLSSNPVAIGTDLYDIDHNGTLWRITSPNAPAVPVASVGIFPTGGNGQPILSDYYMTVVGNTLYFTTADSTSGNGQYDLWKCQGSTATPIWESPLEGAYSPLQVVGVGSDVYFTDANGEDPPRLWQSDGTTQGTELLQSFTYQVFSQDTAAIPFALTAVGSDLYFEGTDGRLWESSGTPQMAHATAISLAPPGGETTADFYAHTDLSYNFAEYSPLVAVGSTLYFTTATPYLTNGDLERLNDPPVANVTQTDPTGAAVTGQVVTLTLGANDPDTVDQTAGFTYQINYGDGTSTQTVASPSGLQVMHAYSSPGDYTVTMTATDQAGGFSDLASTAVQVNALTAGNLLTALPSGGTVTIQADTSNAATVVEAINDLSSQSATVNGTVILNLTPDNYGGLTVNVPDGMTLVIGTTNYTGGQQAIIDPGTPAFTVASGNVIVSNVTFVTTGDAPTILVTGGHLTLRNDIIQTSTGFNDPAISITGGTVDLGTAADPGGNTFYSSAAFISNTSGIAIVAADDTFELTVTASSSLMQVGNSPPPLLGFVNGTPFVGSITYTTISGDQVTLRLSTTATSASAVGQYAITAILSGAGANQYVINPTTSTMGTMYVVSVGADPSSTTGAEAVTFWDNKGNAKFITAADLSSLDALNLVTQGGSAFDPKAVAQLQAWLSVSPNATTAYQLAVQLAAMNLNVLVGYVKPTDLVYAGALLPYATTYVITGLSSGGFIDMQDLMSAANAVLSQVSPGNSSGDPNQAIEAALTEVLQAVNGNTDFVQP